MRRGGLVDCLHGICCYQQMYAHNALIIIVKN